MADIRNSNLLNTTGILKKKDACVIIVRTLWNASIVDELEKGCREELTRLGIKGIETLVVPGAFEIAFAVRKYWVRRRLLPRRPDAFIALGCVLRGGTPHFEYICQAVTEGIVQLNMTLPVPTIFGVLTVDTQEQAIARTGGNQGHKGQEAAATACHMISLFANRRRRKK